MSLITSFLYSSRSFANNKGYVEDNLLEFETSERYNSEIIDVSNGLDTSDYSNQGSESVCQGEDCLVSKELEMNILYDPLYASDGDKSIMGEGYQPSYILQEINVLATRTERKTSEIPAMTDNISVYDDFSIVGASNLNELFKNSAAVSSKGSGRNNGQLPSIRGFTRDSIVVLLDGIRYNFGSEHDGRIFIEPSVLKSVQVLRGSGSSLYGGNALGGVMLFETLSAIDLATPDKQSGALINTGFQLGSQEVSGAAILYNLTERTDTLVSVSYRHSGDIALGGSDPQLKLISQDDVTNLFAKFAYSLDEYSTIQYTGIFYNGDSIEPSNPIDIQTERNPIADKNIESYTNIVRYDFNKQDNIIAELQADLYFNRTTVSKKTDFFIGTTPPQPDGIREVLRDMGTVGFNINAKSYKGRGELQSHTIVYGIEGYRDQQDGADNKSANGRYGAAPNASSTYYGFYLQDEFLYDIGDNKQKILVIPGFRFDTYNSSSQIDPALQNVSESAFSPKVAVNYMYEDISIFASYGQGFRPPSLTERFSDDVHFPGNRFVPNPYLKPEKSLNMEVGFAYEGDASDFAELGSAISIKGALYYMEIKDMINRNVDFIARTTEFANIDRANVHGMEIEGRYTSESVRFLLSYAYSNAVNPNTGYKLSTSVAPTLIMLIEKRLRSDQYFGFRTTLVGSRTFFDYSPSGRMQNMYIPNYQTFDIYYAIENPEEGVTIKLGINNLLNELYYTDYPGAYAEGRNFFATALLKF